MGGGGGHIHLPVFPLRCPDRRGKNQGGGGEKYRAPPPPPPPRLLLCGRWEKVFPSLPQPRPTSSYAFQQCLPPLPALFLWQKVREKFFLFRREKGKKKGIELLHSREGKKEDWLAAAAKPAEDSPMLRSPVKKSPTLTHGCPGRLPSGGMPDKILYFKAGTQCERN